MLLKSSSRFLKKKTFLIQAYFHYNSSYHLKSEQVYDRCHSTFGNNPHFKAHCLPFLFVWVIILMFWVCSFKHSLLQYVFCFSRQEVSVCLWSELLIFLGCKSRDIFLKSHSSLFAVRYRLNLSSGLWFWPRAICCRPYVMAVGWKLHLASVVLFGGWRPPSWFSTAVGFWLQSKTFYFWWRCEFISLLKPVDFSCNCLFRRLKKVLLKTSSKWTITLFRSHFI